MAKLEDVVSPSEILEMIKAGALKTELIKRYKTSEQELAMVLVPLYRGGEITKEDFNNFFQGLPLSQPEMPAAEAPEAPPPPVQKPVQGPAQEPAQKRTQEPAREPAREPAKEPVQELAHEPVQELAQEPAQEPAKEPAKEPVDRPGEIIRSLKKFIGKRTPIDSAQPQESPIEDAHEEIAAQDVELEVEEVVDSVPETGVEQEPIAVTEALQAILKKLDSIDGRLSGIEKKLGLD